ncbi:MAG: STAS domain-containing protein [Akkermansiaceae bacterium]|nr:STAS domain-containing protein [Akkermansiaceae bacterium]
MQSTKKRRLYHPRILGLFGSLRGTYSLSSEVFAGLTVGLIALPLSLALGIASIPAGAETPFPVPTLGIVTAIVAGFLISFLGGSRVQIGGPTAAFVPIILLIVSEHGYHGLLVATTMAGAILILMGLSGLGRLVKFIPWPVTSGFTTGIAAALILTQIPDFAGLRVEADPLPREFVERIAWFFHHSNSFNGRSLLLGVFCLGLILFWPKLKIPRIPGSIVAIAAASLWVHFFGWSGDAGVETIATKFGAGALPSGLPAPSLPAFDWFLVREMIGPATAIAILGAIESLLSAVVADGLTNERHDSNTELVGQGIANLISPLFGGLPATGAIARTSANIHNGGRTPIAGMVHALSLLLIILLGAKLAGYIPMAAMAAVLVAVAFRMGEWHELSRLAKLPRSDTLVLLTTFLLTFVFDLVIAIEVGMVLAAMLFIKRIAETTEVSLVTSEDMLERPEHIAQGKTIPEGVLVYRVFGPFMFGAVEQMEDALARIGEWPKVLILRLHLVTAIDATGMNALASVVERMKKRGGHVVISGIHQQPLQTLRKAGLIDHFRRENFCPTFDDALTRASLLTEAASSMENPDNTPK